MTPARQNELAAVIILLAAVLSLVALIGESGPLRPWRDGLLWLLGRAAILVPIWLVLIAVQAVPLLTGRRPGWQRLAGAGLATAGVLTLLHLGLGETVREVARGDGGGQLGAVLGWLLIGLTGRAVAGPIALLALLAGIGLLLGRWLPLAGRQIVQSWSTLQQNRLSDVDVAAEPSAPTRRPTRASKTAKRTLEEEYAARFRDPASPRGARSAGQPARVEGELPAAPLPQLILPKAIERRPATEERTRQPAVRLTAGSALWALPGIELLDSFPDVEADPEDAQSKARVIDQTLTNFKVDAHVKEIYAGPSFTQFAVEPGVGVKVRRITELQNDLALALAVPSLRIEAPVPGKARVGIEIPNVTTATVGLRETLESEEWHSARSRLKLPIVLGRDVSGRPVVVDLARMPHLLIAGATGAGKSVCLNAVITCLLLQMTPDELRLVMIDPKRVELSSYNGIPHLQSPVVTEMDRVVGLLRKAVEEMERRYDLLQRLGVRNLDGYHQRCQREARLERLPYLVLIVDELADLMMTAPEEVEGQLCRLAQMGRATGIHLILATQRPSVDVVTGLIKANFPSRIAFAVSSQIDSRVILDSPGAERLMGRGDMLYQASDAPKPQRIQGVYLSDSNIEEIVAAWRRQADGANFDPTWVNVPTTPTGAEAAPAADELLEQATVIVRQHGTASASLLQRRLRIGYNRAARLIEQLEQQGVIGPAQSKLRAVVGEAGEAGVESLPAGKDDDELPL